MYMLLVEQVVDGRTRCFGIMVRTNTWFYMQLLSLFNEVGRATYFKQHFVTQLQKGNFHFIIILPKVTLHGMAWHIGALENARKA
jgi:hypothetical protein